MTIQVMAPSMEMTETKYCESRKASAREEEEEEKEDTGRRSREEERLKEEGRRNEEVERRERRRVEERTLKTCKAEEAHCLHNLERRKH